MVLSAIERENRRELEIAAHRLKGTFGALAAKPAADAARRLEDIARVGKLNQAGPPLDALKSELNRLEEELLAFAGAAAQGAPTCES